MSAVRYREFVLHNGAVWMAAVAFVKAHAKTFAAKGEPLRLIVTARERKRNAE